MKSLKVLVIWNVFLTIILLIGAGDNNLSVDTLTAKRIVVTNEKAIGSVEIFVNSQVSGVWCQKDSEHFSSIMYNKSDGPVLELNNIKLERGADFAISLNNRRTSFQYRDKNGKLTGEIK